VWANNNLNGFIALVESLLLINQQGNKKARVVDSVIEPKPILKKVSNS